MADDPGLPTGMVQNLSGVPGHAPRSLMLPEIQASEGSYPAESPSDCPAIINVKIKSMYLGVHPKAFVLEEPQRH